MTAATWESLNGRQRLALRWLAAHTEPPPRGAADYIVPRKTAYAFSLGDAMVKGGLGTHQQADSTGEARSAANTLVSLKRRKLADNDQGGVFVQNRWWITRAGLELVP